jgi:hypothetical protein
VISTPRSDLRTRVLADNLRTRTIGAVMFVFRAPSCLTCTNIR